MQNAINTAKEETKKSVTNASAKTTDFIIEVKDDAVEVSKEIKEATSTQYQKARDVVSPKVEETKKQIIETKNDITKTTKETSKQAKEKAIKIPSDIDKRSKDLLNKAFKGAPIEDNNDLPVDSLIYTHPTNYRTNEYLPVKPRLREIQTDDTYNAF